MRTQFSDAQLEDPALADAQKNLRACVHCGICTATCPTYVLLGDERDGPRGRLVMMPKMLEEGVAPAQETVFHLDRCLSCLACRPACPSGVAYERLIDVSRAYIEANHRRPAKERVLRAFIGRVLSRPALARPLLVLARLSAPVARHIPGSVGRMVRLAEKLRAGKSLVERAERSGRTPVAILHGCIQCAVAPGIDVALERVLARRGVAAAPLRNAGCCGALSFHLGRTREAKVWAQKNIVAFERAEQEEGAETRTRAATGCAAQLKDYAHLFSDDEEWNARALAF